MNCTDNRASASFTSRVSSPGTPNTYRTPSRQAPDEQLRAGHREGYAIQTDLMLTNSRMPYSDSSRP